MPGFDTGKDEGDGIGVSLLDLLMELLYQKLKGEGGMESDDVSITSVEHLKEFLKETCDGKTMVSIVPDATGESNGNGGDEDG